jgi:DNA-binding NtrC family response regulator
MLEKCGLEVLTACDGREGVETFRNHSDEIRLVLLDMTMPHMGGEEAFEEIKRIRADARVVLSSGYNEQDAIGRFAGKGLAGFIQKPYPVGDLLDKVREALES